MARRRRSRRRSRRIDARIPYLLSMLGYAVVLILVNVRPGWESVPFLTSDAEPVVALFNLTLIVGLASQAVYVVDDRPRLRAGFTYGIALLYLIVLANLWKDLPIDFGDWDPSWASATRLVVLGLAVWAFVIAARAAVRVVLGRRLPRLASNHT